MRILAESEDKSTYQRFMDRGGTLFYNAPCMFLILKKEGTDLDTGIVCQNISLAATSLGLDNVICGMARIPFNGQRVMSLKKKQDLVKDGVWSGCPSWLWEDGK